MVGSYISFLEPIFVCIIFLESQKQYILNPNLVPYLKFSQVGLSYVQHCIGHSDAYMYSFSVPFSFIRVKVLEGTWNDEAEFACSCNVAYLY